MQHLDKGMEPPDREPENDTEDILIWVGKTYSPEEVFTWYQLKDWALSRGFILPENNNSTKDY